MKNFTFLMIFAITTMSVIAQNPSTMDILKSYKWDNDALKDDVLITYFNTFTNTTYKTTIGYDDGEILEDNYQYYLSDNREHTFDQSKVGTAQYGKFIIAKQIPTGKVMCFRIVTLNNTKLSILYLSAPGERMLGVGPVTFYAKPK